MEPHSPIDPPPGRSVLERALARMDGIVDWERRDRSAGMVRSLEPVRDLLGRLGEPQRAFRAVHVTGSKGKGSVAALVAAGLTAAGLRTGCYASPHVERVTERVRIDGEEAGEGELAAALDAAWAARAEGARRGAPAGEATWFDLLTAAAFLVLRARGVEWAVVEVGLGGRLDSTNVVEGAVAVLTCVELEHTAVLGRTPAAIAREKAAILKPGRVLVTGVARPAEGVAPGAPEASEALQKDTTAAAASVAAVLLERAREVGGRVRFVGGGAGAGPDAFLARNVALAGAVLEELGRLGVAGRDGRPLGPDRLDGEALAAAALPARGERFLVEGVPVVLDVAHVAAGIRELLAGLAADPGLPGPPSLVLALGKDKDAGAVLKALRGAADRVHCTSSPSGPLLGADELAGRARAQGFEASASEDPAGAFALALAEAAAAGGWVLILGSFYTAGALRPLLRARSPARLGPACSPSPPTSS